MKKLIATLLFPVATLIMLPAAMASEGGVRLDKAPIEPTDVVSLQSGARTFANYCLNCHSASLMRWNRLMELGLNESQIKDNLIFDGSKVGDLMNVSMTKKDGRKWFGAAPPDLSVIARARGADWLYSYLRGFYRDPARPTGWNNTVYENVGMPNPMWQLQGERVRVEHAVKGGEGKEAHGGAASTVKYEMVKPGSMTAVQYDETVRDLVNFLVYIGEPAATSRKQTGIFVLLFLFAILPLVYLLKREFWKDVH
ncbi:MAG: cytochrome c1 [Burkholderiales bacterium]|nr:cytochrome c1 [Burkholderiales bacterium]MCJ7838334.1 cytochrome c1 [Burkholderiales bacterium]